MRGFGGTITSHKYEPVETEDAEAGCKDQDRHVQAPPRQQGVPLWCWFVLSASIVAVSGAATVFRKVRDVPPLVLAAWRLQLTAAILAPGAALQWRGMPAEDRARALHADWRWSAASGAALAVHFGLWVTSLEATSLPHALLLVSTTPVLLVLLALARRDAVSAGEAGGALLAVAGGALMSAGASGTGENEVTAAGDAAALGASAAFVLYLHAGKTLRSYQPIFVYAFPVTALGAALLTVAGFAVEGQSLVGSDRRGVFGWLASSHYAPYVAYLGFCGGIIGHTGFNAVLKHMSSLSVALVMNLEPVLGPVIGWAFGEVAPPGVFTWLGGAVVLVATVVVTVATSQRQQHEADMQRRREAEAQLLEVLGQRQHASPRRHHCEQGVHQLWQQEQRQQWHEEAEQQQQQAGSVGGVASGQQHGVAERELTEVRTKVVGHRMCDEVETAAQPASPSSSGARPGLRHRPATPPPSPPPSPPPPRGGNETWSVVPLHNVQAS